MKPIFLSLLPFLPTLYAAPTQNQILPRANADDPPLRGSPDLLGYSSDNKLTEHTTEGVKYKLVPGQKEDAKIGSYLDLEDVENPQPIRGDMGGTDSTSRMIPCLHVYIVRRQLAIAFVHEDFDADLCDTRTTRLRPLPQR